ncbi:MAG TPA: ABC transporter permease [Puia sp.]|uniref:ABC transporter permease n=1 Tax=Puia sp. TaxID=2045100 RepID=UPI002BD813CA|nr:ABC transporter permease [Puia sp.]HVU95174.1 ABC transporter permease [Puia sp.]
MSSTITTAAPITRQSRPALTLPSAKTVFSSLLKADLTAQWRNRRATIMVVLIPSIILISWKSIVAFKGGAFALSNCIAIGLNAIGLMGYTNAIARDRDKGIFQRLRVTPAPRWTIIASRLAVQLFMILITTVLLFAIGYQFDHIILKASSYALGFLTAIVGGAVYLSLGQMIVGLVKTPETVNVTTRLVFFLFIMIGQFASFGAFGPEITAIADWSPYGTTKNILAAAFTPGAWVNQTNMYLLASIGYTAIFTLFGIRYFRWSTK